MFQPNFDLLQIEHPKSDISSSNKSDECYTLNCGTLLYPDFQSFGADLLDFLENKYVDVEAGWRTNLALPKSFGKVKQHKGHKGRLTKKCKGFNLYKSGCILQAMSIDHDCTHPHDNLSRLKTNDSLVNESFEDGSTLSQSKPCKKRRNKRDKVPLAVPLSYPSPYNNFSYRKPDETFCPRMRGELLIPVETIKKYYCKDVFPGSGTREC